MCNLSPDEFFQRLQSRMRAPLPGRAAQRRTAPPLSYGRHHGPAPYDAKQAAVVVLLYPRERQWQTSLIVRADQSRHHGGQVAFPGGRMEPGETAWQAARRELHEEVGVVAASERLAGALTPVYVYASNFLVTPFVLIDDGPPRFRLSPDEVDSIIELPLTALPTADDWTLDVIPGRPVAGRVPQMQLGSRRLWGASAMILAEFVTLLQSEFALYGCRKA